MSVYLPAAKEVLDVVGPLTGRDATLDSAAPFAPGPNHPATVAQYIDSTGKLRATIALDLALSAALGAALALAPQTVIDEALEERKIPDLLQEALGEVMNILTSSFNGAEGDHLSLHEVHHAGDPLPNHVRAHALTLGKRLDVRITVPGYGAGRLSVVCDLL